MKIDRSASVLALVLCLAALPVCAQDAAQPSASQTSSQPSQQPSAPPTLQAPEGTAQQPADASRPVLVKRPEPEAKPAGPPKPVSVLAVVRDKKGNIVANLTQPEFNLDQEGQALTVSQFAREGETPLVLGILADTGPGQRKELADERKSATDFSKRLLRAGKDKAFVLHFDEQVELLQDVTVNQDKIAKGIDAISVGEARNQGSGRHRDDPDPSRPHYYTGGGLLFDALFLTSDEVLKGQPGRKAVVLFSDGQDHDSKVSMERAIEAAQRADLAVYTVWVDSERDKTSSGDREPHGSRQRVPGGGGGYPGGGGGYPSPFPGGGGRQQPPVAAPKENKDVGKRALQRIAKETGGRYFEITKKVNADQVYAMVEEELRHQYQLVFTPAKSESGYHKLHLVTRNNEFTVQAREGYYGAE